jgi:adenylate cyclase
MSEPIARHGGEILKFIGDGLLAIFPLSQPSACANLLPAVAEARQATVALSEKNGETGRAPLDYGIGVHVGDVMHGNIGSRTGSTSPSSVLRVNMASRLETLTAARTTLIFEALVALRKSHTFSEISLHAEGLPLTGSSKPCDVML